MGYADHTPGYRITAKEQALAWILDEAQNLEALRQRLDLGVADLGPDPKPGTVGELRRTCDQFFVRHGAVVGMLSALHRLDQLSDEQYQQIRQRVTLTLANMSRTLRAY